MKRIFLAILTLSCCSLFAQQQDYSFTAVPFVNVHLSENFSPPRLQINYNITISASFLRCKKTGRVNEELKPV